MVTDAIIIAKFLQFAATFILFGSSLFYLYSHNSIWVGTRSDRWAWPHRILLVAAGIAILASLGWLVAETASMTEDVPGAFRPSALGSVIWETSFGHIWLVRIALLVSSFTALLTCLPSNMLWGLQAIGGGVIVASFALTGHGGMDDGLAGLIHLVGDVLHLLAAGVWLGALLPLAILVLHSLRQQDAIDARAAYHGLDGFSGIGLAVVAVLILTGLINSWFLIGLSHWRELFTTAYGIALLMKLGLFFGMLALAAMNRLHLTPRLSVAIEQGHSIAVSLGSLRSSVLIETGLALFVLAAVSVLGTLEPPISGG